VGQSSVWIGSPAFQTARHEQRGNPANANQAGTIYDSKILAITIYSINLTNSPWALKLSWHSYMSIFYDNVTDPVFGF